MTVIVGIFSADLRPGSLGAQGRDLGDAAHEQIRRREHGPHQRETRHEREDEHRPQKEEAGYLS
jgi:hypothetical protein